jgi:hypothetical protein
MIRDDAERVYIAGPYSNGDVELNVLEAKRAGALVMRAGHAPYIPHLNHDFHRDYPADYEDWLRVDLAFLSCCNMVLRIPGFSPGADREVAEARRLGLPVFFTEEELLAYLDDGVEVA